MPRFAANLSMMFTEVPFLDRFAAAAAAGFKGVEYLFPYDFPQAAIAERLAAHGLTQALFNLPPGDWQAGDRGIAALAGREEEFRESVDLALDYARATGCRTLHAMAGVVADPADRAAAWDRYLENLRHACGRAAADGITILVEPLNTRDVPGYLLTRQDEARQAIAAVGAANLRLQLDFYHCQIMEGDLAVHLRDYADVIGHIQIAGVPDRHEPDIGEVNYPYLFDRMDRQGYAGWVGCEYRPRGDTAAGLGWLRRAVAP